MTRRLPRIARLAILPLGLALAAVAAQTRLAANWELSWVLADAIPGIAFQVLGQVAWARRPESRIGPLMVATGIAWFSGTLAVTANVIVAILAHAFQGYYDAFLAWLVLAYPTGRLLGWPAKATVGAFFAVLAARTVFRLVTYRPNNAYDFSDPAAADRFVADVRLRESGEAVFQVVIAAVAIAVLALVVRRLVRGSGPDRRIAGPVLVGGLAIALGIVVEVVALLSARTPDALRAAWDLGTALTNGLASLVPIAFVVGLARNRLARGRVADLVIELDRTSERQALRDVLARALGDPSLEVAYAVPDGDGFVDATGRPVDLPSADHPTRASTRLESAGRTVAVLVHDPAIAEEPDLVRSVAAAARLALENERLAAEVRAQLLDVRASRARIVAAGDAERRRVERDLHDGAQQRLVTLALALQVARGQADGSNPELNATLERSTRELELALAELRELARGLHPTVLTEAGLGAAVDALADRSVVPVAVDVTPARFAPAVEATAYFVVAEALTNIAKYAAATTASVHVLEHDGTLMVTVTDDGGGGADPGRGSGLRGLDDRVAAAGGRFSVASAPGAGTTIRAEIPCA